MEKSESVASVCSKWWYSSLARDTGLARHTKARLRRCAAPMDAMVIESVHDLGQKLILAGYNKVNADVLALIAISMAHVQVSNDKSPKIAEIFGRQNSKKGPKILSEQRFQTLIRTTEHRELIIPLRRSIALVHNQSINVAILARDLFYWNEQTRIEWCYQYYGAIMTLEKVEKGDQ